MILPKTLYKYRSLSEQSKDITKRLLSEGEIYFATTDELNDPLERFFKFRNGTYGVYTKDEIKKYNLQIFSQNQNGSVMGYLDSEEMTKYLMDNNKKNETRGILSLCESKSEILMYAHYADGFKGICIGLDWEKIDLIFDGSHPPEKNKPLKVCYKNDPPEIDGKPEEWIEVFTTKSIEFSYEKEWRMFYKKGVVPQEFRRNVRNAISDITFGHLCSEENIEEVKELVKDQNVNFFVAKPVVGKFELEIVPLENV